MTELNKSLLTKPFRLLELASYGAGSIVSRAIRKSSQGNITFFAFAKGEQLSPHSAPYDAFLQVLEGETRVMIAQEHHTLKAGDAVILVANVAHAVEAVQDMKMLLVMIKEPD